MSWQLNFLKQPLKFIEKNVISKEVIIGQVVNAIKYLQGETVNINLKKLKGEWKNHYRIRISKIRVLVSFDFDQKIAEITVIDFRGDVYK